jgi:hypothetical protein
MTRTDTRPTGHEHRASDEQPVPRVVSYGGGVQSNALLVLAAQGRIDFRTFLFANVGHDSENPATLRYVRDVAMPYAATHGIQLHELRNVKREGTVETLYGRLVRPGSQSLPIPVNYKIAVIGRWLRQHGASRADPATVAVRFSTDEFHRANRKRAQPWETPAYPLLDLGLSRAGCEALIADAGLAVPPKSACWFCTFTGPPTGPRDAATTPTCSPGPWRSSNNSTTADPGCAARPAAGPPPSMSSTTATRPPPVRPGCGTPTPAATEPSHRGTRQPCGCGQHVTITADGRWPAHHKVPVYLSRFGRPLDQAIAEAQPSLFDPDGPHTCDEGHCWT